MRITLIARCTEDAEGMAGLRVAVKRWRDEGHRVRPRVTFEAGDARRFAARARRDADLIVVAGGDGTLNEVANGLVRPGRRPRLAVLPAGTGNDFATGLGLPEELNACVRIALEGEPVRVDLGRVNRRAFVNVSLGGLGAGATRTASEESKRLLGPFAYIVSGAREVAEARTYGGRIEVDDEAVFEGEFLFYAVGNGPLTGGGTRIAPAADTGDGMLDLVVLRAVPRLELIALLPEIRAGEHLSHPAVLHMRGRRVLVRLDEEVPVNVDGEPLSGRRFDYRVTGERVSVMAPAGASKQNGPGHRSRPFLVVAWV